MEPSEAIDNICTMQSEDNVGLSDIIDILNTLDSHNPELNGTQIPIEAQETTQPQVSPPIPSPQQPQNTSKKPYIRIVEQPGENLQRFRYGSEGRFAGVIPGRNSTAENKTYPTIEIVGYQGEVVVVVSCVTKDPPYKPHPHSLVGRDDGFKDGIYTVTLNQEPLRAVFTNLGIQCCKKKDVTENLTLREILCVDPFKTKFAHKDQPSSINLKAVRLCFQAFLKTASGQLPKPLVPVVSDPIYDKKAMSELVICRLCSCSARVGGGDEIIMLCENFVKGDIKVRFYETNNEETVVWEDFAEFQQTDIHKQVAIAFKTPRYHNTDILDKAQVFLQLVRPSDGKTSQSLPFEYYPDPDQIKRKRLKTGGNPTHILRRELQKQDQQPNAQFQNDFKDISNYNANFWGASFKMEPAMSPQNFGPHRSPYQMSPSPQPLSPNNRNTTPSPGLMKTLSAGSQTHMSDVLNFNTVQQYHNGMQTHNTNNNTANPFVGHLSVASNTSGGSITPLWPTDSNVLHYQTLNIPVTISLQQHQQQQLQSQQQQQQQAMPQLPNDIEMLANANITTSEEGPTLSGLLAFVDNEQWVNLNSDDLPLSNLSITT